MCSIDEYYTEKTNEFSTKAFSIRLKLVDQNQFKQVSYVMHKLYGWICT